MAIHENGRGEQPPNAVGDYEVGYGKPPRHTRFKKGRSGNPGGRPKRNLTLAEHMGEELAREMTITEGGRRRKRPVGAILCRRMLHDAVNGDAAARKDVIKLDAKRPQLEDDIPMVFTLHFDEEDERGLQ